MPTWERARLGRGRLLPNLKADLQVARSLGGLQQAGEQGERLGLARLCLHMRRLKAVQPVLGCLERRTEAAHSANSCSKDAHQHWGVRPLGKSGRVISHTQRTAVIGCRAGTCRARGRDSRAWSQKRPLLSAAP